jgi:hypothetical protein
MASSPPRDRLQNVSPPNRFYTIAITITITITIHCSDQHALSLVLLHLASLFARGESSVYKWRWLCGLIRTPLYSLIVWLIAQSGEVEEDFLLISTR